jgi:RNA polymerase-binding transcription factor DksA
MNKHESIHRGPATAATIFGSPVERPPMNSRWRKHFDRLLELRDDIRRRKDCLEETAKEQQPVFSLHMGDAATDEYDRDLALGMANSEQSSIYEIDDALARIRDGTYGICELTGEPIERERLVAIPWARFSEGAQREVEASGAADRTALGRRRSLAGEAVPAHEGGETAEPGTPSDIREKESPAPDHWD